MNNYNPVAKISEEEIGYEVQYSNSNKFLLNRVYDYLKLLKKNGEVTLFASGRAIVSLEKIIEIIRIKRPDYNYFIKNDILNENVQYLITDSKPNQKEII